MPELHGGGSDEQGLLQQSAVAEASSGGEHGGGAQSDELVVMTCHMHNETAKKGINEPAKKFKEFWDDLARYIMEFGVRLLTGDFNMALWCAIVELRARGFQANVAAWYPWKNHLEETVRMDSCAIFVIGPVMGVRKMFDPSVMCDGDRRE